MKICPAKEYLIARKRWIQSWRGCRKLKRLWRTLSRDECEAVRRTLRIGTMP